MGKGSKVCFITHCCFVLLFQVTLLLPLRLCLRWFWDPVKSLGSHGGWSEVNVWEAVVQTLIFGLSCEFLGQAPSPRGFLRWMMHSVADLFSPSSSAPGFLPNSFIRVQFPWHKRPLSTPLDPWNIHIPSSCKTSVVQAALLLRFLLALCCRCPQPLLT